MASFGGCDLVKIKIGTLVAGPAIRTRSMVIQQKTGRPVQFEITAETRASLLAWLERRGGSVVDFAFPSRLAANGHLSTRQYARLVDDWVTAIGLTPEEYGTYSMRRTKASLIHKATGNLRDPDIAGAVARSRTPFGTSGWTSTTLSRYPKLLKSNAQRLRRRFSTGVGEAPHSGRSARLSNFPKAVGPLGSRQRRQRGGKRTDCFWDNEEL